MIAEEILRRLTALKTAAQDFNQMAAMIDGNYETRLGEIKALEEKRDRIKGTIDDYQDKANNVLQAASEEAALIRKEALKLLEEAKVAKLQVSQDQVSARQLTAEAQALYQQAVERQKTADSQWRMMEDKKKKLEEAMR